MSLKKKAEKKLQSVGKKIGIKAVSLVKKYKTARAKADAAYAASPKGKKMKAFVKAGGRV